MVADRDRRRAAVAFLLLAGSHFVIDAYSSGYAPLLPLLRDRLGLTLAQVGWCTAVLTFSSSLLQPLYGWLSDRLRNRVVLALAPAVSGIGLGALGMTDGYGAALGAFFVVGIGIAAFHPQGATQAREASERRPGVLVALFFGGGHLGFAVGPLLAAAAVGVWGWGGLWRLALPGVIASLALARWARVPAPQRPDQGPLAGALRRRWRPLLRLYLVVVIRGAVQLIYTAFLPLWFIETGTDLAGASVALSIFLAVGALGGLAGGLAGDRVGGAAIVKLSMFGSLPLLPASFLLPWPWQLPVLCAGFFLLLMTMPVVLVMGQDWVPQHRSTVSSLLMGFAWGLGGIAAPLVGVVADRYGMRAALIAVGLLPAIGAWIAAGVKNPPSPGVAQDGPR